jgi:hypothetical protein
MTARLELEAAARKRQAKHRSRVGAARTLLQTPKAEDSSMRLGSQVDK